MPGYTYRGAIRDAEPAPAPKVKRTRSPHPSPCGTPGAYARHRKHGEPIDAACEQANKDACKQYRQRMKGNANGVSA